MKLLALSWERLNPDTLSKCWNKILKFDVEEFDESDDIPLSIVKKNMEITTLNRTIHLINDLFPEVTSYFLYTYSIHINI